MKTFKKYARPAFVAAGIAVTGSLMALKNFAELDSLAYAESLAVGVIVAAAGAVHELLEDN